MINPKSLANLKPAKPGEVRNPKGKPLGSRHLLQSKFFQDCYELWQAKGKEALELMAAEKPNEFCRMIAQLMPSQMQDVTEPSSVELALQNATYEQLLAVISAANAIVVSGTSEADSKKDGAGTLLTGVH